MKMLYSVFLFSLSAILISIAALAFTEARGLFLLGPPLAFFLCMALFWLNQPKDVCLGFCLALAVLAVMFFLFA